MPVQLIKLLIFAISYTIVSNVFPKLIKASKIKELFKGAILFFFLICFNSASADNVITGGAKVRINSGVIVTMQQPVVIENGGNLSNEGTLILKGNLTNENPAADLGKGTIEFSGTSVQNISGQNTFGKLVVNNPQGLNILGNATVNNELGLLNGLVRLSANNLILGNQAILSGTPSSSSMVIATGTGELRKSFSEKGTFTFPVGDESGAYTPVTLNFTKGKFGSENYAGVTLKPTAFPGNSGKGLNRYWSLTQNGISEFSFDAVFQYVPGDNNGKENELVCVEIEPDTVKSNTPANTTLHQITASGLNSFGTFTGIFNQKVGTQPTMEMTEFKCFPNPFTNQITIEIPNPGNDELSVEIYNVSGQLIKTLYQGIHDGNLELKWDATNESDQKMVPGVYIVKVNGQSKQLIFESTQP